MNRLGVGVIGVGSIADMHLAAYAANPDVDLVGVFDVDQERNQRKAEKFAVGTAHKSLESLLNDPDVHAVSVCTWNDSHAEITVKALQAGKHVLLEKPLARSVQESERIADAVHQSGKHLEVGFVRRFSPNAQVLKRFVDKGVLGDVYHAKAANIRRIGNPGGWFADSTRSGGGPLIDLGVHVLDLCWYFMGTPEPISVSGFTHSPLGNRANIESLSRYKVSDYSPEGNDVEDFSGALIRFKNGSTLMLESSYSLHALDDRLEVVLYGEHGGAELEPNLRLATEFEDTLVNWEPQIDHLSFDFDTGFANEIDHFVALCLGEAEAVAPVEHGVAVTLMLSAIYESSKQGCEVRL